MFKLCAPPTVSVIAAVVDRVKGAEDCLAGSAVGVSRLGLDVGTVVSN